MKPEGLGLLLAAVAGLTTTIGGLCVFMVNRIKALPLAFSMAIAAGVMFFLSFVELFATALRFFENALVGAPSQEEELSAEEGISESHRHASLAFLYTSLLFFAGWLLVSLLNKVVHVVLGCSGCNSCLTSNKHRLIAQVMEPKMHGNLHHHEMEGKTVQQDDNKPVVVQPACLDGPTDVENASKSSKPQIRDSSLGTDEPCTPATAPIPEGEMLPSKEGLISKCLRCCMLKSPPSEKELQVERQVQEELFASYTAISHVGTFTAIALILHNLPEGIATYIAVLDSLRMGIGITVAIAIHNIPEGIAVAVPIYYGTGSRWKAFFFSLIAGLAEPLGALIGYLTLTRNSNLVILAVLMALVAGCMANLSVQQLYPMAIRYDPLDRVVSLCTFLSMFVMAMSLVGFKMSGL